ncbi:MAG: DUF4249 family protein [Bacteroidales bacterium]|nr:DUF4249 family protein [Bacteroidales bacterium]
MKKLFYLFLVIIASCSNDLDIQGEGNAIPVVYCLLNPLEEEQFVRVGKTFLLSEERIETTIPADSTLWVEDASVYIEKWKDRNLVETIVFEVSEFSERDSGLFPSEGLKIYNAYFKPISGEEYHLFVYFDELDKIVSAETIVLDIPEIIDPVNVPGRKVSFDTISPLNIRWKAGDQEGLYQGFFKMNYTESLSDDHSFQNCMFGTRLYIINEPAEIYEEKISGLNFLKSVANQVKPIDGISREVVSFEFLFYASGPELAIIVNSETGISNPFVIIRNSSNIAGGIGVFSSLCYQRVPNLEPSETTKYFLATSTYTKNLGFSEN